MKKLDCQIYGKVCSWSRLVICLIVAILIVTMIIIPFVIYNLIYSMRKPSMKSIHRLPTTVIPSHYRLYIDASQLENFLFSGRVHIDIQISQVIDEILLNSADLTITKIRFQSNNFPSYLNGSIEYNHNCEQIKMKFNQTLQPGYGRLFLAFHGKINDQLHGFYRTQNQNQTGACTQFEPAYARRAFPCFDEPSMKSNFTIIIRSPANRTTLSNMPVKSKSIGTNQTMIYRFDTTPRMSTYLVAYVIGYYDLIEKHDANDVLIRVYTPIGKKKQGVFALETAVKILPFFAEYFGIKYPLKKLDLIAIADFGSGAMENWGLATFRETYLLVDSQTSTQKTRQDVALVVAHELAHQWFGNLVTMEWWNDLWLNEDNFASWIEFLAVDYVYPEYDIWTQFVSDTLATCMVADALQNSHPIEVTIEKPSEIDEIFDDITYEKGSSVIRLLHAYIGDKAFRHGLSNYLAEYAYENTMTEHLWSHFSRASNYSHLSDVLSTWTKQMGYPLLSVEQEQQGTKRLLTIEQTRFLADGTQDDRVKWKIPINICTKSFPNQSVHQIYLHGVKKQTFLLENIPETDWIKLNVFSVGIYRVHYSPTMLDALTPGIHDHTLSPQDRFNIQTDVYALARAGHLAYVDYLKLLRYAYKHEDNLTVWKSILRQLAELNSIFDYAHLNTTKRLYQAYVIDLLENIYQELGWNPMTNESSQLTILRSLILTHMGVNGHKEIAREAHRRFEIFVHAKNHSSFFDPNIRAAIYLTVAKTGDQRIFNQIKSLYFQADTQEERVRLLTALSRFDNPILQSQALDFIWNTTLVRRQDHFTGFISLAAHNRHGCEISWKYMRNNWKQIEMIYGQHDSHLIHFVENVPGLFASEQRREEVRKFYHTHPNPLLDRPIKKVLEYIHIRRLVLERHERSINEFLRIS